MNEARSVQSRAESRIARRAHIQILDPPIHNFVKIYDQLVPPDTWFNQHITARGNHITIEVNGKRVVDYVDEKNTFSKGYLALQQHNKGSIVMFKNLTMKPLPGSGS